MAGWSGSAERVDGEVLRASVRGRVAAAIVWRHAGGPSAARGGFCGRGDGRIAYTQSRGGHVTMLAHHFGRNISEAQRRRWVNLLRDSADEIGLPSDPEFRSALVAYLEWGSRLAVMNSKLPTGTVADPATPMPKWGWGVPGGPYRPVQE